jgi:hypothetical protein
LERSRRARTQAEAFEQLCRERAAFDFELGRKFTLTRATTLAERLVRHWKFPIGWGGEGKFAVAATPLDVSRVARAFRLDFWRQKRGGAWCATAVAHRANWQASTGWGFSAPTCRERDQLAAKVTRLLVPTEGTKPAPADRQRGGFFDQQRFASSRPPAQIGCQLRLLDGAGGRVLLRKLAHALLTSGALRCTGNGSEMARICCTGHGGVLSLVCGGNSRRRAAPMPAKRFRLR